jgi:hypothetical protein
VDDAGERGVLTQEADAGVAHSEVQETGLARREPELGDRAKAFLRTQRSNSSASPPLVRRPSRHRLARPVER